MILQLQSAKNSQICWDWLIKQNFIKSHCNSWLILQNTFKLSHSCRKSMKTDTNIDLLNSSCWLNRKADLLSYWLTANAWGIWRWRPGACTQASPHQKSWVTLYLGPQAAIRCVWTNARTPSRPGRWGMIKACWWHCGPTTLRKESRRGRETF